MKKKIISIIGSIVMVALCVGVFYISQDNENVDKIRENVQNVTKDNDDKNEVKKDDENELEKLFGEGECLCDLLSKKYSDWQTMGYKIQPKMKYDSNNISLEKDAYGVTVASEDVFRVLGSCQAKLSNEYKNSAPEYALNEGELREIYMPDMIRKTKEKLCDPFVLCDFTVDDIKLSDKMNISEDMKKYVTYDGVYDIIDDNGQLKKILPDSDFKGDLSKYGNLCCIEMYVSVKSNCPWITYVNPQFDMIWLNDNKEYYSYDDEVVRPDKYEPSLGYDGSPVYSESYNDNNGYPLASGEEHTFKYMYIVDKASLNNLYFVYNSMHSMNDASTKYTYVIKAKND